MKGGSPESVEALWADAVARQGSAELAGAEALYRRIIGIDPALAQAHNNLAAVLRDQGRFEEAAAAFERAIALSPDYARAHMGLGMVRLQTGDFTGGWPEYEWRSAFTTVNSVSRAAPRWTGAPLGGKPIMLQAEQGFGDTIQFVRYVPMVKARGGRVILAAPRPLIRLFNRVEGIDQLIDAGRGSALASCWAPLMSLPGLFGTTLDTIPAPGAYLAADERLVALWKGRLVARRGLKVGVAWRGSPENLDDPTRSLTPVQLSSALEGSNISIVSLQKDATADEIAALGPSVLDAGPRLGDFADTAALVANLDLVISVDTSVAHLAGALGAPCWTLLAFCPDWRWFLGRDDSPWYPGMRLFRQRAPGDWDSVTGAVRSALSRVKSGRQGQ